jgi:hypothetical protein
MAFSSANGRGIRSIFSDLDCISFPREFVMVAQKYQNRDTASLLAEMWSKAGRNDDLEDAMECAAAILSASVCTFLAGSFTALDQLKSIAFPEHELASTQEMRVLPLVDVPDRDEA